MMENADTLDHLLKIEAEASALVNDAQQEADRRTHENEEKNRVVFEEHFRVEVQMLESTLKKEREKVRKQYQQALDEYRQEISGIKVNVEKFSALLNEYLAE